MGKRKKTMTAKKTMKMMRRRRRRKTKKTPKRWIYPTAKNA
jgi:hypothetical protein